MSAADRPPYDAPEALDQENLDTVGAISATPPSEDAWEPRTPAHASGALLFALGAVALVIAIVGLPGTEAVVTDGSAALRQGWAAKRQAAVQATTEQAAPNDGQADPGQPVDGLPQNR